MNGTTSSKGLVGVITASSVGTLIEWYDFYIFGSLAVVIATKFFPAGDPTAALLSTLATFGAGFVVRPFGALVFGRLGDLAGRKFTFLLTLVLMGLSTFAIGCIPAFETIGYWAPVLVLLLRLLQGLALGGEYGGAATYVAEHAPSTARGFWTSWIQTTATIGLFLSLAVIITVKQSMSIDDFNEWGWRIPFWISIIMVGVSIVIRLRMQESPLFARLKQTGTTSSNPLRESFGNRLNLKFVLLALFGATMGQGVVWYTGQFYALSFIQNTLHVELAQASRLIMWALLLGTPFFIFFGWLSDKIGRKWIMLAGMLLAVFLYRPLYTAMYEIGTSAEHTVVNVNGTVNTILLSDTGFWQLVGLVFIQVVLVTMVYGPIAAFLVELFPTRIRYTSMSLPYHVGNGIFGGMLPLVATYLTSQAARANEVAAKGGLTLPYDKPYLEGLWYPMAVAGVCFVIGALFIDAKDNRIDD
ncbi:MAG: MFS transporter [Bacteroidetes bacterium]|nr:MFS transporter [Bacteroidota bacterium]